MEEIITLEFVQDYLNTTVFDLYSTHDKICFPTLERIFKKIKSGEKFRPINVDNDAIVDGHHRYICLHILGLEIEKINWTRSPSSKITPWNQVIIETIDWYHHKKHKK